MSVSTQAPPFTALFVFGDSLSDNGAVANLVGGQLPPVNAVDSDGNPVDLTGTGVFYNNRFTNGDVFADVSAGQLNIPGDTSTFYDDFSGSNYAVGGATATNLSVIGQNTVNTLEAQVFAFVSAATIAIPIESAREAFLATTAASIKIGLNDVNAVGQAAIDPNTGAVDQALIAEGVAAVINEIDDQTTDLVEIGVGTIILNLLPGGSFFPASNDAIALLNATAGQGAGEALFDSVTAAVNDGIKAIAAGLEASGAANVQVIDYFSLASEIQADQETFGFLTLENVLSGAGPLGPQELLIDDVPIEQVGFIDEVHYSASMHKVFGAFQALTLFNEQIDGEDDRDVIITGSGDQTIFANGGNDFISARAGDDLVFAGDGEDRAFGGFGDDVMFGGLGHDSVFGGFGNDVVSGGSGNDWVTGGFGHDVVAGNDGNDRLAGHLGDDLLIDGLGSDKAYGGFGDDVFLHRTADAIGGVTGEDSDYFDGGRGDDTLLIVSNAPVDVDAYLAENNIEIRRIEEVIILSEAELDSYFETTSFADAAETADLFGLA